MHLCFFLSPSSPFRLDLTVWGIRCRPENLVDQVGWQDLPARIGYPRQTGAHECYTIRGVNAPRLGVTAFVAYLPTSRQERGDHRPRAVVGAAGRLHELASRYRGLKPPRFRTVWEGLVNGVACRQFSLTVGILLLNRLAALCGLPFGKDAARLAFPRPNDLSAVAPKSLRPLGFNRAETHELIGLAKETASGELDLEAFTNLDKGEAVSRLLDPLGVGRWTAEYVLLRGMSRIDIFPGDDIGARNNLARWMHVRRPLDYCRVMRVVDKWKPYRGLIYFICCWTH